MNTQSKPWEHAKSGGSEQDELATRFVQSLSYDTRMYKQDIRGSIAHAYMLHDSKLITSDDLNAILSGLSRIQQEIEDAGITGWSGWKEELEDVHMCIEAALVARIGDSGRKLHTGRSRNDQVALDLKLWIQDAAKEISYVYETLLASLVKLAESDGKIPMPSYTHLQRAQPIVVGGELMAWASAFDRCLTRLMITSIIDSGNPLGSGAIAGSSLPLDRNHTADALQVGRPTSNSMDATASRDDAIDFVYALAMTAMWLSRWAEQWIIYMTSEFGFITIGDAYTTGSSMMPQKRNPDMLELIRGRCGNVYGNLMSLLTICKGITIGYNRDLQEDKRHLFAAYDTVSDCLKMASRIIDSTHFSEEHIAHNLDNGYLDATMLAEYLVNKGVPFRTAHQHIGQLVRLCNEQGKTKLANISLEEMRSVCDQIDSDVVEHLGAANAIKHYQSFGNAGLNGFEQQLNAWKERMADNA